MFTSQRHASKYWWRTKESFQEDAKNIESVLVSAQAGKQIILDCSS